MFSKLRRVHKMTYVLWAWCLLILTWAIAGGASAENSAHCSTQAYSKLCQNATDAGTAIGVAIVLLIGFFGFAFLSMIWFMTRPNNQEAAA
jgi:hypothetical protein